MAEHRQWFAVVCEGNVCFWGSTTAGRILHLISGVGDRFDVFSTVILACLSVVASSLRLDALPRASSCRPRLEGLGRANRWVKDLVERQETEIIRSPLTASHYPRPPPGASWCFTYYLTPCWPVPLSEVGVQASSSVKWTNSSTNRHILQHTAMTQQLWEAHYFLHPPRDDWLVTLFGFFGNIQEEYKVEL